MEKEPTTEEMVDLLKKRKWLPFTSGSVLTILVELLEQPLSKIEMKKLTNQGAQRAFMETFKSTEGDLIRKVFGRDKRGRDIIKYELTDRGREFVLDQLHVIKTFYEAVGGVRIPMPKSVDEVIREEGDVAAAVRKNLKAAGLKKEGRKYGQF